MTRRPSIFVSVFALPLLAVCVSAQVSGGPPPEIRARIDAFLTGFNSGSADAFDAMAKKPFTPASYGRRPAAERASVYKQVFADFGTIAMERATRSGPGAPLKLHVKGATGATGVISLE